MDASETFGQRLKRLRTVRGLRVLDLGYAAGITEGAIRQIESGQTKSASLLAGIRLAKLLGVSAEYLATGTESRADDDGLLRVLLDRLDNHERRLAAMEART